MAMNKLRNILVSTADREATYDAGAVIDSLIRADADVFIQEEVALYNDKDTLTGTEEGTGQEKMAVHVPFTLSQAAGKPHTIAFLAALALGTVTSSLVGTTAKKHMIRAVPLAQLTLPSIQVEGVMGDGTQKKITGVFADSFELGWSNSPERLIKVSAQLYGSGTIATGTSTASEITEDILTARSAALWLDETTYAGATSDALSLATSELNGSPEKVSENITSFSYKVTNNTDLSLLWFPGSGFVFGRTLRGERKQTVSITFLATDSDHTDRLLSQNAAALQLKVQGTQIEAGRNNGLNLIIPKLQYAAARRGRQGALVSVAVEAEVYQRGTWPTVLLEIFNSQANYLV